MPLPLPVARRGHRVAPRDPLRSCHKARHWAADSGKQGPRNTMVHTSMLQCCSLGYLYCDRGRIPRSPSRSSRILRASMPIARKSAKRVPEVVDFPRSLRDPAHRRTHRLTASTARSTLGPTQRLSSGTMQFRRAPLAAALLLALVALAAVPLGKRRGWRNLVADFQPPRLAGLPVPAPAQLF